MITATCDSCAKTYSVPAADRAYRCKACGGTVSVAAADSEPAEVASAAEPDQADACSECSAPLAAGARFCEACGAAVGAAGAGAPSGADRVRRGVVRDELRRAKKKLGRVRLLYVLSAGLTLFFALIPLTALLQLRAAGRDGTEVAITAGVLLLIISVFVVGAQRLEREPLLWSLLGAGLKTIDALFCLVNQIWVGAVMAGLWALALWAAVRAVVRAAPLMRAHPEEWAQLSGMVRSATGKGARSRARPVVPNNGPPWLPAVTAVAGLALLVSGFAGAHVPKAPPTIDAALGRFLEVWHRSDVDGVSAMLPDNLASKTKTWLVRPGKNRDWSQGLPVLSETWRSVNDRSATTRFSVAGGGGTLTVTWGRDGDSWSPRSLKYE